MFLPKILDCNFCGDAPQVHFRDNRWLVSCGYCEAEEGRSTTVSAPTERGALLKWNEAIEHDLEEERDDQIPRCDECFSILTIPLGQRQPSCESCAPVELC